MKCGPKPGTRRDHSGETIGRFLLLSLDTEPVEHGHYRYRVRCHCGNEFVTRLDGLLDGHTQSCGCWHFGRALHVTHGMSHTPEWNAWVEMRKRCKNPKYENYGGRGIAVCKRWLKFENFLADMGKKPSPAHSIDRIDNDGNYEPENCRWATDSEQMKNRRPFMHKSWATRRANTVRK